MNDNYPDIPNEPDSRGSDVLLIHEGTRSACSETAWRHLEEMGVDTDCDMGVAMAGDTCGGELGVGAGDKEASGMGFVRRDDEECARR